MNCFVKCHGYHGLGDQWNAVNEQTVRNLMPYIRFKDFAYENSLSSESIASELCDSFPSIFSGLVMIDKKKIGMMWVEDED
ncbi:hypothetical protein [Bacillus subtilis]|uniref:hypothetical protein n=1 Tax=Bacillus subtilis TaxID=1423 RepID=UPI0013E90473|nr:hypothetical protein [Bacillus subtilis]